MEFLTTRQLLLAGRGEEASGSSMLGSLCKQRDEKHVGDTQLMNSVYWSTMGSDCTSVLEVSMVGMGFALDSVIEI